MEIKNEFYVYFHLKEDTGEIFYVGKGKNKRAFSRHGRNDYWLKVVNKHGLKVVIVKESLSNEDACELEKQYIKEFGRSNNGGLINSGGNQYMKQKDFIIKKMFKVPSNEQMTAAPGIT